MPLAGPTRKEIDRMSHIVAIQTQVRDAAALAAACTRLGLGQPAHGTAELYSSRATGQIVRLEGWHYPVVIDTATGKSAFAKALGNETGRPTLVMDVGA